MFAEYSQKHKTKIGCSNESPWKKSGPPSTQSVATFLVQKVQYDLG